jgi:hypothetical protein
MFQEFPYERGFAAIAAAGDDDGPTLPANYPSVHNEPAACGLPDVQV